MISHKKQGLEKLFPMVHKDGRGELELLLIILRQAQIQGNVKHQMTWHLNRLGNIIGWTLKVMIRTLTLLWWRLLDSPTNHYKNYKLELPEAWKHLDNS